MGSIKIAYTNKEITAWGGMILLKNMLDRLNFREVISNCIWLPKQGSNRGYSVYTIIEAFIVSVWRGANRFMHTELTRHDKVIGKIFGWSNTPAQDVYKRYFKKFTQSINQKVFGYLYEWFFSELEFDNYTLDFDSSVIVRYGNQQGAKKVYNPKKPGRLSHHPLIAFVADCNMVANMWLRSGDSHTTNNLKGFIQDTLSHLKGKTIGLIRLDSGFYDKDVFDYLEQLGIHYIVAVKLYTNVQRLLLSHKTWLKLAEGVEIASCLYQSPLWDKPRRILMVRQEVEKRPKATGKQLSLFEEECMYNNYRYGAYITNMELSAAEVWRLYRQRANAENRIKELKYDFGFDNFNLHDFLPTEAALSLVMIAFNLMSLFIQFILNSNTQKRLSTVRYEILAIGAYLIKKAKNIVLKLSLVCKRREWFTGLWNNSKELNLPLKFSNA